MTSRLGTGKSFKLFYSVVLKKVPGFEKRNNPIGVIHSVFLTLTLGLERGMMDALDSYQASNSSGISNSSGTINSSDINNKMDSSSSNSKDAGLLQQQGSCNSRTPATTGSLQNQEAYNSKNVSSDSKARITINVPLFKKLRDIIFFWWDNHFMSHFEGHFEGAKTFFYP